MKMPCIESGVIGDTPRGRIVGWIIGLSLLLIAFSAAATEQKSPGKIPAPKETGSLRLAAAGKEGPARNSLSVAAARVLTGLTARQESGNLVISASTSGPVKFKTFVLKNPHRLVVDLLDAENKVPFAELPVNDRQVKQVRVRQFDNKESMVARLVFDLAEHYSKHEILDESQAIRVVFQGAASSPKPVAAKQVPLPARAPSSKPANPPARAAVSDTRGPSPITEKLPTPAPRPLMVTEIPAGTLETSPPSTPKAPSRALAVKEISPAAVPAPSRAPVPTTPVPRPAPVAGQDTRFSGAPLTLDLVDIPLVDFFRLMAEEGGINIVMDPEIKGTISIKVVKVPWDQIFDAALANNGLDKLVEGNLVRIARRATMQEEAKQREALKKAEVLAADLETRVKRLNYAKANAFLPLLTEQKSVRGTVVVEDRTNSLIITDIPSFLEKMSQLVESLDQPQPQVEIEARIVSATRDFARDIGVQFGFVQGNLERVTVGGPNTFGTIGGTRPSSTPTNTYAAGDTRTGRGAAQSSSSQSAGVSTGTSSQNAGNFNVNLPSGKAFGGLGISVGNIFDTFLLDAAITAGENKGLAKLISQPKVTAQNNSPATITQGLRFPVQIIANNTISVSFQNAALTLIVTPQITYEGNIVLDLQIENNTPDFSRSVNGIPSIRTSESKTRVLVGDGGTTVIGGILIDNEQTQEDRVPGLASLPIIGNVFRRTSVSHSTQEVLFFITPRIVK